jgi:hypothetical protein
MPPSDENADALGFRMRRAIGHPEQRVSYVAPQHALRRILSFTGHSIDDVVNSRMAHRKVLIYYRMHKLIHRRSEITDLEQQWNSVA